MGQVSFANDIEHDPARDVEEAKENQTYSVYNYDETPANKSWAGALPVKQGLYDPELEKDACGVGFAAYVQFICSVCATKECLLICWTATSKVFLVTRLLAMVSFIHKYSISIN